MKLSHTVTEPHGWGAHNHKPNRDGGVMLSVLVMAVPLMLILGTLTSASMQRVHSLRLETYRLRAIAIAEAGLNQAFGELELNPTIFGNGSPVAQDTNFAGGAYRVEAISPMLGVVVLTSTGIYRGQEVLAMASVSLALTDDNDDDDNSGPVLPGPFGAIGLYAGANLTMSGGMIVNAPEFGVHANGSMTLSGGARLNGHSVSTHGNIAMSGNPQIQLQGGQGRMHADGNINLAGTINASQITSHSSIAGNWGTSTSAENMAPSVTWPNWFNPMPPVVQQPVDTVPYVPMPTLDVEAYKNFAIANGYFYSGNQDVTRQWLTADILARTGVNVNNNETLVEPQGGVFFVDGNVTVGQDMNMNGMLIATGNITLGGGSTLSNPTEFPALVSTDGNITIGGGTSGPEINGWVYAMNGSVAMGGGATGLTGVMAAQNLTITAGFTLNIDPDAKWVSAPPGTGGGGNDDSGSGQTDGVVSLLSWIR